MRLRKIKNSSKILSNSKNFIPNPELYKGKWKEEFKNSNPIHIEIGMGKGKFIRENALNNSNINYIGIDKFDTILAKALRNINEYIPNLRVINYDAKELENIFDNEIDLLYLTFSDPWPKTRHEKRRLTYETFLKIYDKILKNTKKIVLRTDNRNLFEYSIISLTNYGYKIKSINLDLHNSNEIFITTEYEDKFVSKGNLIYQIECYKCI